LSNKGLIVCILVTTFKSNKMCHIWGHTDTHTHWHKSQIVWH